MDSEFAFTKQNDDITSVINNMRFFGIHSFRKIERENFITLDDYTLDGDE